MEPYRILTDRDVEAELTMPAAIALMERALVTKSMGALVAPPRFAVSGERGGLVFTAGGRNGDDAVIGFRVYDTFEGSALADGRVQLVTVFDGATGGLRGIVLGNLIGAIRTAAIGGVALRYLAPKRARSLAIIGAGFQASYQADAALSVLAVDSVRIHSRTRSSEEALGQHIADAYGVSAVVCSSIEEAIADAEVIICATNSATPVLRREHMRPGLHVSTIGPKTIERHELDREIALVCDFIASDSLDQIRSYPAPFFIADVDRITPLEDVVTGVSQGRQSDDDITLFCSVGLAGTEVLLANELLRRVDGG